MVKYAEAAEERRRSARGDGWFFLSALLRWLEQYSYWPCTISQGGSVKTALAGSDLMNAVKSGREREGEKSLVEEDI